MMHTAAFGETWTKMASLNVDKCRSDPAKYIVNYARDEFGAEKVDRVSTKTGDQMAFETWHTDQRLLSIWVEGLEKVVGKGKINRDGHGPRIDRNKWPLKLTEDLFNSAMDAHVFQERLHEKSVVGNVFLSFSHGF